MGILFVGIFVLSSCLIFIPGLIAALIAWKKEYRPWFWLLSLGPIGTLVILLKPSLSKAATPEERELWETRADWTGGVLSGFTLFPMFVMPVVFLLGAFTFRATAVPAPMMPAPAPTYIQGAPDDVTSVDDGGTKSVGEPSGSPEEAQAVEQPR